MVDQTPEGGISWYEDDLLAVEEERPWLQVWDRGGGSCSTAAPRRNAGPCRRAARWRHSPTTTGSCRSTVRGEDAPMRILNRRGRIASKPVVIQVAASEAALQDQVREVMLIFLLGLPVAVAVAGLGGYALARRALEPVETMTERARSITADRLGRSAPGGEPRRRDGAAGRRVQRDAGPAAAFVRADAAVHVRRVARAAHAADLDPQRRRSGAARTPRRAGLSHHHRQHAGGGRSAGGSRGPPADAVARRDRTGAALERGRGPAGAGRQRRVAPQRAGRGEAAADRRGTERRRRRRSPIDRCCGRRSSTWWTTRSSSRRSADRCGCACRRRRAKPCATWWTRAPACRPRHASTSSTGSTASATRRRSGGAGLGLSIARGAVEANGGRLTLVESSESGSTFRISMPRVVRRPRPVPA